MVPPPAPFGPEAASQKHGTGVRVVVLRSSQLSGMPLLSAGVSVRDTAHPHKHARAPPQQLTCVTVSEREGAVDSVAVGEEQADVGDRAAGLETLQADLVRSTAVV